MPILTQNRKNPMDHGNTSGEKISSAHTTCRVALHQFSSKSFNPKITTTVFAWYENRWYQSICEIEVKETETRIFIQVRAPYQSGNSPIPVGRNQCCYYSSESLKYNIWDNLSSRRRYSGMDHHP